jgi:uncharacterized membrane protein required for colicin V production
VDIVGSIANITIADLVVFFLLFAMFILGFMQGVIRRLTGIATILLSLLIAGQLQAPLGSFLASNWRQYSPEYNEMVAFGTIFLAGAVGAAILAQIFIKPIPLFTAHKVVDEVIGGLLGVLQGALIIAAFYVITDPFFSLGGQARGNELPLVRQLHDALQGSVTADIARTRLVPILLLLFGGILPASVSKAFGS